MIALRLLGALFAVGLFLVSLYRYPKRQISRLNLIISWVIGVAIVVLAIAPNLFNPIFDAFNFRPGGQRRLLAVELFAIIVLFALIVRNMSFTDVSIRSIRDLTEALAVQAFDWERADEIPEGRRIVVISPAYNEAENVGAVIAELPEEIDGLRVVPVVIDDGSEDSTSDEARKAGALVARLPIRRGGGLALRVGYELAVRLGAEVVVSIDADGQHVPDEMPLLVRPILEGDADLVNGSRLLGDFQRESVVRHIGVHFFSWVVTIATGQRITDPSNGYRATRPEILKRLSLDEDQFWASELLIEALRTRARITEVPITIRARQAGQSKKPKSLKYGWHFAKAIIKTWLK
ncbi:MAG: glycosyltransferase family 2 protein [Actinomycetota bacterium]